MPLVILEAHLIQWVCLYLNDDFFYVKFLFHANCYSQWVVSKNEISAPKQTQIILGDNLQVLKTEPHPPAVLFDGVITSPPYVIFIKCTTLSSHCRYNMGRQNREWFKQTMLKDHIPEATYLTNMVALFRIFESRVRQDGPVLFILSYCCRSPSLPAKLICAVELQTDYRLADTLIWKKQLIRPNWVSSCHPARICESIYVFARSNYQHSFRTNRTLSRKRSVRGQAIYRSPAKFINFMETKNCDRDIRAKCPVKTTFPVELVHKLLEFYFPLKSFILDPFSGKHVLLYMIHA